MANQIIQSSKKNVLIGCSGSVACIKVPNIITELKAKDPLLNVSIFFHCILNIFNIQLTKFYRLE